MSNVRSVMIEFPNGLKVGNGGNFAVNGKVRAPSRYKCGLHDEDLDAKRSTTGKLTRNRVRKDVYTIDVGWDRLDWDELVALIQAGDDSSFDLKFVDPKSKSGYTTKTVHRNANMEYELIHLYSDEDAYWTTTMSFVEL